MKKVTIYTDGACLGNPGPGGYGVVLAYGDRKKELSAGFAETTNNRMELLAIIVGLEALKQPCEVTVYSDSRYVIDQITSGTIHRWKARGWARKRKRLVINLDLWKRLYPLLSTHSITWEWVKGHAGVDANERCDWLAGSAASQKDNPPDMGYQEEKLRRSPPELFD